MKILRRIRGALGMGLLWAVGGAGVGMMIELSANILGGDFHDAMAAAVDIWPALLAIVGFLGGVVFATVLGLVTRRRRFEELSLSWFAAWGAMAGLLLGGVMVATLGAPAGFIGITTLWSGIAAPGSLLLARRAEQQAVLEAGVDDSTLGVR
ncbi:MAG: hypothetical protein ACREOK_15890 [Gemmatimonadaceae bacterium]